MLFLGLMSQVCCYCRWGEGKPFDAASAEVLTNDHNEAASSLSSPKRKVRATFLTSNESTVCRKEKVGLLLLEWAGSSRKYVGSVEP